MEKCKCKLVRDLEYGPSAGPRLAGTIAAVGTVLETETAHLLVCNGDAVPHDDECARRCYRKLFPKQAVDDVLSEDELNQLKLRVTQLIRQKDPVAAGIHPEDYDDFFAGKMTGYDPDTGDPSPGPNAEYDGPLELPN